LESIRGDLTIFVYLTSTERHVINGDVTGVLTGAKNLNNLRVHFDSVGPNSKYNLTTY